VVIYYSSVRKLICMLLWETKYKVPCFTEQPVTLYWGKCKAGEAIMEKRFLFLSFSSLGSRMLEQLVGKLDSSTQQLNYQCNYLLS